jgi:hypothetical protein
MVPLVVAFLLLPRGGLAREGPRPPCYGVPSPAAAAVGPMPHVQVWYGTDFPNGWQPPACIGWQARPFVLMVAVAGRFRAAAGVKEILGRLGAVSRFTSIRYWSVTRGRWTDLVDKAHALSGPSAEHARGDFSPEELSAGSTLYFWQHENSPAGGLVYRLSVRERTRDRLVFATANAHEVRFLLLPLFAPDAYQAVYFLDHEENGVWRYYGILRVGGRPIGPVERFRRSYINRVVAIYRYLAGFATDGAPPGAP